MQQRIRFVSIAITLVLGPILGYAPRSVAAEAIYEVAAFTVDVTIPLGHRCMGVLPIKSRRILDPLYAHGFVLLGPDRPIVLVAVDWCEIRNDSYDQWRDTLAVAVGTDRERVLVSALHQHDAPVVDAGAAALLDDVGLPGELFDEQFHDDAVDRVAQAARDAIVGRQRVTHIGLGSTLVENVASNRRVVDSDGQVTFSRSSRSGGDPRYRDAPVGLIDPQLRTVSFWNQDRPLVAIHSYATHPMSSYGQGGVSADFVGLARERRQRDDFSVKQIYVSGCSGDVTAGKHNDGSPEHREMLTGKMYDAMVRAWQKVTRHSIDRVAFRSVPLELEFHRGEQFSAVALEATLRDPALTVEKRILAAMGLASLQRVAKGRAIDMPCIDFGVAQIVLFPGESFVGYQIRAQQLRPESFVFPIGYGECWPGYIPTRSAFADNFGDSWLWVAPGAEEKMLAALRAVLLVD